MKQSNQEKYTVAWFKLAEFVARGEKERALGLYRLLAHSFDDIALGHQLEGDLFNSFHDEQAAVSYQKAFEIYKKQGRLVESAALCETLLTIKPHAISTAQETIQVYKKLQQSPGVVRGYKALLKAYCFHKKWFELLESISLVQQDFQPQEVSGIFFDLVKQLLEAQAPSQTIENALELMMKWFIHDSQAQYLSAFLIKMKALDDSWHDYAQLLLQK